jgi:orotidine-5'-phosphate decarboxylase
MLIDKIPTRTFTEGAVGNFLEKLEKISKKNKSLLCVGLDPNPAQVPVRDIFEFNKTIIESTQHLVCAYKPNLAFYEALGLEGLRILEKTVTAIPAEIPVIGDAKRGDIGSTSQAHATALYDYWGFDAITCNPFAGFDSIEPLLRPGKGVFFWCRSSNPSASDFQDLMVSSTSSDTAVPFYEYMAQTIASWKTEGDLGLVVGATYPSELKRIREVCPLLPILVPGVGSQGGTLVDSVVNGIDSRGAGILISVSRQVLYASSDSDNYAIAATGAAEILRSSINEALRSEGSTWMK